MTIKWQTPSKCSKDSNYCVGVGSLPSGEVAITNTRTAGFIPFTPEEIKYFIDAVKAGEYDSYA